MHFVIAETCVVPFAFAGGADPSRPAMRTTVFCVILLFSSNVTALAAETGLASFYPGIGKRDEMTCAHRSHPFGKRLRVSHGNVSIECRVNDRGPFIRGRIIDVSTRAARALGMVDAGVVRVRVEPVEPMPAGPKIEITSVPTGAL
jgi:rare lipoprotein A